MDESTTLSIKDRYLALGFCVLLIICYMALAVMKIDTKFIENITLFMIGVFGGLLKSSTNTNIERSNTTNVSKDT